MKISNAVAPAAARVKPINVKDILTPSPTVPANPAKDQLLLRSKPSADLPIDINTGTGPTFPVPPKDVLPQASARKAWDSFMDKVTRFVIGDIFGMRNVNSGKRISAFD